MKKTHIIALIVIAVSVGVIFSSVTDSSTYSNFTEAFSNEGNKYTVVGWLNKEKEIIAEPTQCTFYIIDKDSVEKKVIYNQPKPQDFERSESIVITGKAHEGVFYANEISLKCPSKYNDVNKNNKAQK
jgi:cytochrome c-type biogenesis protein CcmE